MIVFRNADPRYPFLWEQSEQRAARYNAENDGPAQYFADTPDGAWAEFIRHAEIDDPDELECVNRAIWSIEIPDEKAASFTLSIADATGGKDSYLSCQKYARNLRDEGGKRIHAPSAALVPGGARGWRVDNGLQPAPAREGVTIVIFGYLPQCTGWKICVGKPPIEVLSITRPL